MKRREFLRLVGAGFVARLLGKVLPAEGAAPSPAGPRRPNVVLIISDDQAWCDHGFMGHPAIRTPRLDRLATQSLVFTRGYVPTALCRPSLAAISTGLYPHQHRIVGNDPKGGSNDLPAREAMIRRFEELPSLARLLGKAGVVSLQTGKWWEGSYRRGGFTQGMTHGNPKRGGRHGDAGLNIGRKGLQPILDFLDRAKADGKCFFLWYAPFLPHAPHNPPKELLEKYTAPDRPPAIAAYWAMCEWFDQTCGELLDALDKRGLANNTLVAYVVDNGWVQPASGRPSFDALRGKRTPYEGGVRTPIMLRWPGRVQPRRDEEHLASSIDLMPTILAACGVECPAGLPGINLLDAAAVAGREALFGAAYEHNLQDLDDPAKSLRHRWCIEGRWKLILPYAARVPEAKAELYDVLADPHEKADLADKHSEKVKHLTGLLDRWWAMK